RSSRGSLVPRLAGVMASDDVLRDVIRSTRSVISDLPVDSPAKGVCTGLSTARYPLASHFPMGVVNAQRSVRNLAVIYRPANARCRGLCHCERLFPVTDRPEKPTGGGRDAHRPRDSEDSGSAVTSP